MPDTGSRGWRASTWRRDASGQYVILIRFSDLLGQMREIEVPNSFIDRPTLLLERLRDEGADLPRDRAAALADIANLLDRTEKRPRQLAEQTGWKADKRAFVTPHKVIGQYRGHLKPAKELKASKIGRSRGNLARWQEHVGKPAAASSYMSFGIMMALAAPLLVFSRLPESMVFNFAGASSTGKTTLAKVAASVSGPPEFASWDATPRGLHETAAAHNDLLMILDDTERRSASSAMLADEISKMGHQITSGRSKSYSRNAQRQGLEPLRWNAIVLSTSPETITAMASRGRRARTAGDQVRLIDIPVPAAQDGGVFDRVTEGKPADLADSIAHAVTRYYGTLMPEWISYLVTLSDREQVVQKLTERYVKKSATAATGVEMRLARKFALIYAAGKLAVRAGLLPWPEIHPLIAVKRCHLAARRLYSPDPRELQAVLAKLVAAINDPEVFHLRQRKKNVISKGGFADWMGFRERNGAEAWVWSEALERLAGGPQMRENLVAYLHEHNVLATNSRGKKTHQRRVACSSLSTSQPSGYLLSVPRLKHLTASTESRSRCGRRPLSREAGPSGLGRDRDRAAL